MKGPAAKKIIRKGARMDAAPGVIEISSKPSAAAWGEPCTMSGARESSRAWMSSVMAAF